ncbi:MAG TPA: hypothetical protein VHM47_00230 [Actinomycetota bacterium]|jgi:hypothetical protein|nr:hypothetical protein [Actinomycetota bacterium]
MSDPKNRGQQLRAFFVLLAMIFLVGAGAAYGATWYRQSELEADATRDARRLSLDVLQPLLVTTDAQGPVRGVRYDELLAAVDERVLAGPINGALLLAQDGTVLFADQAALVGDHQPALRDDIHAVISGTSQSSVDGDRFRTLTVLEIGSPPTLVAAELVRSHSAIVEESREPWYPWVGRAITAAIVCFGLALVTAIVFSVIGVLARRSARRRSAVAAPRQQRKKADRVADETLPAYMQPSFKDEVAARRRAEEELNAIQHERDALAVRVQRLEAELDRLKDRSSV